MPDRMPDRMPENMSDRMPEDLPVTKCINVMVGITRSKVFFFEFPNQFIMVLYRIFSDFGPYNGSLQYYTRGIKVANKKWLMSSPDEC